LRRAVTGEGSQPAGIGLSLMPAIARARWPVVPLCIPFGV